MLIMSQINHIRDLKQCGYRIAEIAKKVGADHKTIRKYLEKESFSPAPPITSKKPSILDPYKTTIQAYLDEDKKHWYKQHHTAMRIFHRLVDEEQYPGSYSIVQRYVKTLRKNSLEKANLELIWEPGTAQVDFGEADFEENGRTVRLKYLTVSFPYSNDGYSQIFGGETAECVCQGLQNIFSYIGGVPPLLIFDNATGVGPGIAYMTLSMSLGFLANSGHTANSACATAIRPPVTKKAMSSARSATPVPISSFPCPNSQTELPSTGRF